MGRFGCDRGGETYPDYCVIDMNTGGDITARNISLRMAEENIDRLDCLVSAMGRSRAWVLNQATQRYLEYQEWFVQPLEEGIEDIKRGNTVSNEQVLAEVRQNLPARPIKVRDQPTHCLASATSMESPSRFSASSPVSGVWPEVD